MTRVRISAIVLTVALVAVHSETRAQTRRGVQVRLDPSLGASLPFGGALIDEASLHKQQVTSAVFAGRLAVSPSRHFGFEGTIGFGRGLIAIRDSSNHVRDVTATLVLSSLKTVFRFNPNSRGVVMHVASGPGLISRGGKAWADTPPRGAQPAWVISAGGSARLTRRGKVDFRFELEVFLSWAQFNVGLPTETRSLLHHDIIWSFGLSFPILGH
ncbi:MAG: hypothetical protein HY700_15495 [Gemmatimonadetes bacterium]|nr:hypothetical protein [Gemmatimonadota bacterium]